ncbi:MAG: hypothetical protein ACRCSF_04965, partial [Mycobacteriaceae bacterium]
MNPFSVLVMLWEEILMGDWCEGIPLAEAIQKSATNPNLSHTATLSLEALSAVMDPLNALASAGVGWLIEHISFLNEGLDNLCGDSSAIELEADKWRITVSDGITRCQDDLRISREIMDDSWDGLASESFSSSLKGMEVVLESLSVAATSVSGGLYMAGELVSIEREIIRDLIADFIGEVLVEVLVAAASSWFTFGGSAAAAVASIVARACML